EAEVERTSAVPIRRSVHRDYVVCLECGWRGRMLKRHVATGHGLTVEQYRARWNLTREHPMTAPGYSEQRSSLAKQIGLGRGSRASSEERNTGKRKPAITATSFSTAWKATSSDADLTRTEVSPCSGFLSQ